MRIGGKILLTHHLVIVLMFGLAVPGVGVSQEDGDSWFKKTQSSVSGSIGATGTLYNAIGIDARRDPFFWQLNANLQINSLGMSIPFSAVLSQQQRDFTQPFNQFGLSPKYKWLTTHIGYRSMRFSEFSLNGNQFLGLGFDLNPKEGLVRGKILYGRFNKAVDGFFSDGLVIGTPSYERWGYGAAVDFGTQNNKVGFVFFRAKDDPTSLVNFANDATVKPEMNLLFGINTAHKISKKLSLDAEIDWSAYTSDTRLPEEVLAGFSFINNLGRLFIANTSTNFSKALNFNLKYKLKRFNTTLAYRRVDPDYATMGSVYLNNDFEDVSLKLGGKLLKGKLSLMTSGGLQRNNLNDEKISELLRLIGSVSASYVPNESWSINANFANYNTQNRMSLVHSTVGEDTLRYAQISKNAGLQICRTLKIKNNRAAIQAGLNYQNAQINGETNSDFLGGQLGMNVNFTKDKVNAAMMFSANKNVTATSDLLAIGPNLSLSKSLFKDRVAASFVASYLNSYLYGDLSGTIINGKIGLNYNLNNSHNFFCNLNVAQRNDAVNNYMEIITSVGYKFKFRKG